MTDTAPESDPLQDIPVRIIEALRNGTIKPCDVRPNLTAHLMRMAEIADPSIVALGTLDRIEYHKGVRARAGELALLLTGPPEAPPVEATQPVMATVATGNFL